MLSQKFVTHSNLLSYIRSEVIEYCNKYNLPPISVKYNGLGGRKSKAEFSYLPYPAILIWDKLPDWLSTFPPHIRVWYVAQLVRHELKHYEQYIILKKKRIIPYLDDFKENDAYLAGYHHGDNTLRILSTEEINPMRKRNISLYQSFHGNPPKIIRKINIKLPKKGDRLVKIGRLISLDYAPENPSQYEGTQFTHKFSDYGYKWERKNQF